MKNYLKSFSQTALVAASISIQFTGEVDKEAGLLVGGHLYGTSLNNLVLDDIENSQFVTRARPSEGLRFVYLPMESADYEYYPTSHDNSHNAGAQPTGNEQVFYANLATNVPVGCTLRSETSTASPKAFIPYTATSELGTMADAAVDTMLTAG